MSDRRGRTGTERPPEATNSPADPSPASHSPTAYAYALAPTVAVLGVAPVLALVGVRAGLGTAGDAWTTAGGWRLLGAPLALAGLALALWAVQAFARAGVAPSPVETPDRLVTDGPMQYVRNPVYLGTVGGVLGVAVLLASVVAAGYALALAVAYHLVVVRREEPALAERFGGEYDRYRRRVPRWLPAPRSPSRGADRDKS